MANNRTTVVIDGDASGVTSAVTKAEKSINKLSSSVDSQSKNLNRYGEKLGKAFGPGQGLHGRLDNLETPLRDTEGAIARSQMAFIEFGKSGATASDKVGAGFLLAGDAIAAFTSGGVVGIAIASAVAGFSLLASSIMEQEQASKEAEEATKKQAEALQALAKSASDANITISLLNAQQAEKGLRAKVRAADHERRVLQESYNGQLEDYNKLIDKRDSMQNGVARDDLVRLIASEAKRMRVIKANFKKADKIAGDAEKTLKSARDKVLLEEERNANNAITLLTKRLDAKTEVVAKSIAKAERKASRRAGTPKGGVDNGELEKQADAAFKRLSDNAAQERQIAKDNRAFDRSERDADLQWESGLIERKKTQEERFNSWRISANEKVASNAEELERKLQDSFMRNNSAQVAAVRSVISGMEQMAHDGELSIEALADSAITAAGKELTAKGTVHLMAGVANMAATFGAHGGPEAAQGAAMVAVGIGMGAVGGAIGRSGQAAAPSGASAPTDTRQSRAASSSGNGGEGGSTIINFNGPAYDRRGVANVLTAGNRMARHRRVQGA